jgi:AcrR family transcriptional regulator
VSYNSAVNLDDPRTRRTRAGLRSAALALVAEREPSSITLTQVASRAGINRATVYLHYPDLDSLLTDAMEEAVATVASAAELCPLDALADHAPAPFVELFTHVAEHAALYARMLGPGGSARFAVRMRTALADAMQVRFARGARPSGFAAVPVEVHSAFLAGALVGVIAHWATEGAHFPVDRARHTWRLLVAPG